eukprot:gene12199-25628_t
MILRFYKFDGNVLTHARNNQGSLAIFVRFQTTVAPDETISKRKIFRQLVPDILVLNQLDKLDLGYSGRRRPRPSAAQYHAKLDEVDNSTDIPYPFTKGPKSAGPLSYASMISEIPLSDGTPEVAIIGRSNVGKSTLLNALIGFQSHQIEAKVSAKPGETKKLQFYSLGFNRISKTSGLIIVDMPGYGFAFMSEEEKKRCHDMSMEYLRNRGSSLKRVLLILDARHGFKLADILFIRELYGYTSPDNDLQQENNMGSNDTTTTTNDSSNSREKATTSASRTRTKFHWKLQIVLTKCDMVSRSDIAKIILLIKQRLRGDQGILPDYEISTLPVVPVSGYLRRGVVELQKELAALIPPRPPRRDEK